MISIEDLLPKTVADAAAFLFLLFGVSTTFVFATTTVLPHLYPGCLVWQAVHWLIGVYFVHGILANLYYLTTVDTSIRNLLLPTTLQPGWKFCSVCESNSPIRASHCKTCDVCVLRRSHHCIFAGRCVGYKNSRFFVGMLLHLVMGTLYASLLNQFFIWPLLGGLTFWTFWQHMFPIVFLLLGHISFRVAVFCFLSVLNIGGCMFGVGLLLFHVSLLMTNQTVFERSRGVLLYDLKDWRANLRESLGEKWFLIWISPFVASHLPRDGIHFPTYDVLRQEARKVK